MKELKGIVPAVITPLKSSGAIDEKLFAKQVQYLSDSGVDGFFINGTTGDGPLLSNGERLETLRIARDITGGKQFLCAASVHPSTDEVLKEIRTFESLEPDFIVAVTPFYYSVSQEAIVEHFKIIAASSPFPLIIYNIPQCTHNKIYYETLFELAKIENAVGIKDSSGDFITFSRWLYSDFTGRLSVVQGEDYLDGQSLNAGADGIVSGLCNVWVKPYVEMIDASAKGDWKRVHTLQAEINKLYRIIETVNGRVLPAIKAGTTLMGRSSHWLKIRGDELKPDEIKKIEKVINNLNLTD
ncbi:MAG: dihydrodipicolinate synthase family protein [Spirochaetes bacterium]|nr:dihydrodipicolinate synthase family protein [Spirochaetota bacterium]